MYLTEKQNKELDSLKSKYLYLEKEAEKIQIKLELSEGQETDKLNESLNHIENELKDMINIQSESMKIENNLLIDLIFDREYTLSKICF